MTHGKTHRPRYRWTLAFGILATVGTVGLTACASAGSRPTDMSADAHYAAAARERAAAAAAAAKFDPTATRTERIIVDPLAGDYEARTYNPTAEFQAEAAAHREAAAQHLAAARQLEANEAKQCGALPAEAHTACPLHDQLRAIAPVDDGVELTLAPDASVEDFMARVTCHLAFAQTEHYEGMDACPLFLRDVRARAVDAHTVRFTVDDDDLVPELRRRVRTHLDEPMQTGLR